LGGIILLFVKWLFSYSQWLVCDILLLFHLTCRYVADKEACGNDSAALIEVQLKHCESVMELTVSHHEKMQALALEMLDKVMMFISEFFGFFFFWNFCYIPSQLIFFISFDWFLDTCSSLSILTQYTRAAREATRRDEPVRAITRNTCQVAW
jgi:hypothetical protein